MKTRQKIRIIAIVTLITYALVSFAARESEESSYENWAQFEQLVEKLKEKYNNQNNLPQSSDLSSEISEKFSEKEITTSQKEKEELEEEIIEEIANIPPPFTSQAPFAEWDDPIQQDACEESSSLMAIYWAKGLELNKTLAKEKILDIAKYELVNFGVAIDTSAVDTLTRIIKGYFKYDNAKLLTNVKLKDLIAELKNGNVVIIPADGRALKNPYFTPPGPEHHMLLVYDYDEITEEFITNDPGTRRGAAFRYDKDVLFGSIRDYPTGEHLEPEGREKNIISVSK